MSFPSKEQSTVIEHHGKPMIVVAGPGTGKTRTLVERMIRLLMEDQKREVSFITFTRMSRRDTEKKLVDVFGEAALDQQDLTFPRTSTLHTYAKSLVHRYSSIISREPTFSVLIESEGERELVLGEIARDLDIDIDLNLLSDDLSCYRSTGLWPHDFPLSDSDRKKVLKQLKKLLRLYMTYDMEGLVLAACEILKSSNAILPRIFLQVDEYQDLNPMDQQLINLAASHPSSQVVVVCDDAQSIYGFRYAYHEGVRSLWKSSNWKCVCFPNSFRLPSHILNAALDLIAASGYLGATIERKPPSGRRLLALQCTTSNLQVEAVAKYISDLIAESGESVNKTLSYKDMLVLCPTRRFAEIAEKQLNSQYGIPAHMPVSSIIPDDYWKILLLFRILHHSDPLALRQWLPILGLASDEIKIIRDQALDKNVPFFDHCFSRSDERIVNFRIHLDKIRSSASNPEKLSGVLSSLDCLHLPDNFSDFLAELKDENGSLPSLGQIIELTYRKFGVFEPEEVISKDDKVLVTTMHGAKGLESEYCYCLWMNSRFMPMQNRDPEEERRVMYVALTRAKQDVILAFHEEFRGGKRLREEAMSPFLQDISGHLELLRLNVPELRSPSFSFF